MFKKQKKYTVRDDNLRLLFSETEFKVLEQKRSDAIAGFIAVGALLLSTLFFYLLIGNTSLNRYLESTDFELVVTIMGMIFYIAAILSCLSPIIVIGLMIELRKAAREKASLIDLLIRYKRPIPKTE